MTSSFSLLGVILSLLFSLLLFDNTSNRTTGCTFIFAMSGNCLKYEDGANHKKRAVRPDDSLSI